MKSNRTIRTLRRAAIEPQTIGFAGYTPTGKAVRSVAKLRRAERRLALAVGSDVFRRFTVNGMTQRASVKALTKYSNAAPVVQAAWA